MSTSPPIVASPQDLERAIQTIIDELLQARHRGTEAESVHGAIKDIDALRLAGDVGRFVVDAALLEDPPFFRDYPSYGDFKGDPYERVRLAATALLHLPEVGAYALKQPFKEIERLFDLRPDAPWVQQWMISDLPLRSRVIGGAHCMVLKRHPSRSTTDGVVVGNRGFLNVPIEPILLACNERYLVAAVDFPSQPPPWPIVVDALKGASSIYDPRFYERLPTFSRLEEDSIELVFRTSGKTERVPYDEILWRPLDARWHPPRVPDGPRKRGFGIEKA